MNMVIFNQVDMETRMIFQMKNENEKKSRGDVGLNVKSDNMDYDNCPKVLTNAKYRCKSQTSIFFRKRQITK